MNQEMFIQMAKEAAVQLGTIQSEEFALGVAQRGYGIYQRLPTNPDGSFEFKHVFNSLAVEIPRFGPWLKENVTSFQSLEEMVDFILKLCIRDSSARSLPAITDSAFDTVQDTFLSKKRKAASNAVTLSGIDIGILDYTMAGTFALPASRTATAQLLLRYLISKLAAQYMSVERLYTHIYIQGGLRGLARELGLREDSEVEASLHEALKAFQGIHIKRKGFEQHGLLMFGLSGDTSKRVLKIEVSSILGPDNVFRKNRGTMLVPVPTENPEFIGSPNTWASQSVFQLRMLLLMRTRASELARHGGVYISHSDFSTLANESDLNPEIIVPLLNKWMTGEDAFLRVDETGRYSLTNSLTWAQEMMMDAGNASIKGQKRALKSKN